MDIPNAPTSTSPTSISPHAHHLTMSNPSNLSPSPLSPHTHATISLHNPSHLSLLADHDTINSHHSISPPATSSTLLLLSNSNTLSSVTSNYNGQSAFLIRNSPRQENSLSNNSHLYQNPNSPMSLLHHSSSSTEPSPHSIGGARHLSINNQHLQHQSTNLISHSSPHDFSTHDHLSKPSTPTSELPTAPPSSSVLAKSCISTAYG